MREILLQMVDLRATTNIVHSTVTVLRESFQNLEADMDTLQSNLESGQRLDDHFDQNDPEISGIAFMIFSRVHTTLHPALSVRPSVGPSVRPSRFTFLFFCGFWPFCPCPNDMVTSIMAPAHPHATGVAVYPALLHLEQGRALSDQYFLSYSARIEELTNSREAISAKPL